MKLLLRYSSASPFVRKVLVFAHETGLAHYIVKVPTDVWAADSDIVQDNPLGKVPALIGPAGTFIGSFLCCDYLDTLHDGGRLIPADLRQRWPILQIHALADGVMEAAVAHVIERLRRSPALVDINYLERQAGKITRALDVLEIQASSLGDGVDISTITIGCTLGYLDFRLPQLQWRNGRGNLARWEAAFSERPSLAATVPYI